MIIVWTKWTTFTVVMAAHLIFMTWGTLLVEHLSYMGWFCYCSLMLYDYYCLFQDIHIFLSAVLHKNWFEIWVKHINTMYTFSYNFLSIEAAIVCVLTSLLHIIYICMFNIGPQKIITIASLNYHLMLCSLWVFYSTIK